MGTQIDSLILITEIIVAFVAFSSIVASIKLTVRREASPHQTLLVHFFTESGMLAASVCMLPLVLVGFFAEEATVARISCAYAFIGVATYFVLYFRKRLAIDAPTPLGSLVAILGWALALPMLALSVSGWFWEPTLAIIVAVGYWAVVGNALVFVSFLATFVDDLVTANPEESGLPQQIMSRASGLNQPQPPRS
ncbi:MAG: hypothetical protein HKN50_12940 [Gammaproteobacteria bacterium]|nr:hypothetical protein [Gammaproteobacteria bacterium]